MCRGRGTGSGSGGHLRRRHVRLLHSIAAIHLLVLRVLGLVLTTLRGQNCRCLVATRPHVRRVVCWRGHCLRATDRLLRLIVARLGVLTVIHVVLEMRVRNMVSLRRVAQALSLAGSSIERGETGGDG